MNIKGYQQFKKDKENEGVVISEVPKIIYKGINQYGMYYYEHINKNKKPIGFMVIPEYIPITEIVSKDALKREADIVQGFERKRVREAYQEKLKQAEPAKKPLKISEATAPFKKKEDPDPDAGKGKASESADSSKKGI